LAVIIGNLSASGTANGFGSSGLLTRTVHEVETRRMAREGKGFGSSGMGPETIESNIFTCRRESFEETDRSSATVVPLGSALEANEWSDAQILDCPRQASQVMIVCFFLAMPHNRVASKIAV
jgi:hypothetical protein